MRSFLKEVEDLAASAALDAAAKKIDELIPGAVERSMRKLFREKPYQELTEVGFNWAWLLALSEFWQDVDGKAAVKWLHDYLDLAGIKFGQPGYGWSASAAKELARSYVEEVGEAA